VVIAQDPILEDLTLVLLQLGSFLQYEEFMELRTLFWGLNPALWTKYKNCPKIACTACTDLFSRSS
jgi:hypothetical protein